MVLIGQGKLVFEKNTHDFGFINEVDGHAEYTFLFFNTGNKPVTISDVTTTCGCTTPHWTKEEILQGDSGRVTASFNPFNRPGPFSKSLKISSNASNGKMNLHIMGQVRSRPKQAGKDFPANLGLFRLKYKSLNMGRITTEGLSSRDFEIYNDSDASLTLSVDSMKTPEHIQVEFVPIILREKERGVIRIFYDPNEKNDLGFVEDELKILTSEKDSVQVIVKATIEEYFPLMTEAELSEKPRLSIDKRLLTFKKVMQGETVKASFILKNIGKEDLAIRSVKTNCECTVANVTKEIVPAGEESVLEVIFDTEGRKGTEYKNFTIFSNDPFSPTQMVSIKGSVVE